MNINILVWGEFHSITFYLRCKQDISQEYSRDCGWPRRPWPNAGLKKKIKRPKIRFFRKKIKITSGEGVWDWLILYCAICERPLSTDTFFAMEERIEERMDGWYVVFTLPSERHHMLHTQAAVPILICKLILVIFIFLKKIMHNALLWSP